MNQLTGDSYAVDGPFARPPWRCGILQIENPSNPPCPNSPHRGYSQVGHFQIYNPFNSESALEVSTQGTGDALLAITPGPVLRGRFDGNVFVMGFARWRVKEFIQLIPNDPSKELSQRSYGGA